MKVMTWNIRFGGLFGREDYSARIADYLRAQDDTDLLVLTEYQNHRAGQRLAADLSAAGWSMQHTSAQADDELGVLLAARQPLEPVAAVPDSAPHAVALRRHIDAAWLPAAGLMVAGVSLPADETPLRLACWQALHAWVRTQTGLLLLAGDFQSCLPHDDTAGEGRSVGELTDLRRRLIDAWEVCNPERRQHADRLTWYAPDARGMRLDYVFVSPGLKPLFARYAHVVREQRVSDHSALTVKLGD